MAGGGRGAIAKMRKIGAVPDYWATLDGNVASVSMDRLIRLRGKTVCFWQRSLSLKTEKTFAGQVSY